MHRLIFVCYLADFVLDQRLARLAHVDDGADVFEEHEPVVLHAVEARLQPTAARFEATQLLCRCDNYYANYAHTHWIHHSVAAAQKRKKERGEKIESKALKMVEFVIEIHERADTRVKACRTSELVGAHVCLRQAVARQLQVSLGGLAACLETRGDHLERLDLRRQVAALGVARITHAVQLALAVREALAGGGEFGAEALQLAHHVVRLAEHTLGREIVVDVHAHAARQLAHEVGQVLLRLLPHRLFRREVDLEAALLRAHLLHFLLEAALVALQRV
jgi:hypothetical protein